MTNEHEYKKAKSYYMVLKRMIYLEHIASIYANKITTGSIYGDFTKVSKSVIEDVKKRNPNAQLDNIKYSTVYGEMRPETMQSIIQYMKAKGIKIFIDVGSGNCRIPITVASGDGVEKTYGIELVPERFKNGQNAIKELEPFFKTYTQRVHLINDDMLTINFMKLAQNQPVLVFTSNLCFDEVVTQTLYRKLANELPIGSIIMSSNHPKLNHVITVPDNLITENFEHINGNSNIHIQIVDGESVTAWPMTWDGKHNLHIYKKI